LHHDFQIFGHRETLQLSGFFKAEHIPELMRRIGQVVNEARYPSLRLDLSVMEGAYPSALTILLARIKYLQANQIDVVIVPPDDSRFLGQLQRTNWLTLSNISPKNKPALRLDKAIPIFHYTDADGQGNAVNCISKALLLQIPNLDRSQLRSAEWALSEITDNVLNHAESLIGGIVHCQIHHHLKLIEFVVADAGMGIARSLNEPDHGLALQKAISEGVTRNKETNQGNGLYGTWRLATLSKGIFAIQSHRGRLFVRPEGSVKVDSKSTPFPGTYVICQIDYSNPDLIAEALKFQGRVHVPSFDFIEQAFEDATGDFSKIKLAEHVTSTGSRESGRKLANLITNVIRMVDGQRVEIDFDGICVVSSSFADECFGRLISAMGPVEFFSRISFTNIDGAVRAIIDRSVVQRMRIHNQDVG
jgi:anti-sigma regulatory factor (Ser/Thr protein kinase)/anti-anti-sigma regulatory factor